MLFFKTLMLALVLILRLQSSAQASIFLGVSVLAPHLGKWSAGESGATKLFGASLPELVLHARWGLGASKWSILPRLSYTPLAKSLSESGETLRVMRGSLGVSRDLFWGLDLQLGTGVLGWQVAGSGGTVTLDNGNSTSVFGLPSESKIARSLYLETGLGLRMGRLRWDSSVFANGAFSSRLAWSVASQFSWGIL